MQEVIDDFFHAHVDAPRFWWEEVIIPSLTVELPIPRRLTSNTFTLYEMDRYLEESVGLSVTVDVLQKKLVNVGTRTKSGAPSHILAKSWEPYSNLADDTSSHCLELLSHYLVEIGRTKPDDPVFQLPGFTLADPLQDVGEDEVEH
ncbi:hypothetical protein LTR65_009040 [Meristemomyces frigidus]